jgi:hypothetical protein
MSDHGLEGREDRFWEDSRQSLMRVSDFQVPIAFEKLVLGEKGMRHRKVDLADHILENQEDWLCFWKAQSLY